MGKTTLAVDIIMKNIIPKVRRCFAVCPTFYVQKTLKPLRMIKNAFTKDTVFTDVNDSVFYNIYKILSSKPAPSLLFVDDAAAEQATNKGNKGAFSRLCLASPHLNLTIVGCFQRLTAASCSLRDNAEGLISFIPSKVLDVDTIYQEFNPSPASKKTERVVQDALREAWERSRFCFIWRENFTGRIAYYSGFHYKINFK